MRTWKSIPETGQFGLNQPEKERKTFIQILVQHKDYLHRCYNANLHETDEDIKWIWNNLKEKEKEMIKKMIIE